MLSRCICVGREESLIERKNLLIFRVTHCSVTRCVTYIFLRKRKKIQSIKFSFPIQVEMKFFGPTQTEIWEQRDPFPCTSTHFLKYFASPKLREKWIFIFILEWKTTQVKFLYARRNFLLLLPFPEFRFRPFPSGLRFSWVTCLAVQNSNFGSRRRVVFLRVFFNREGKKKLPRFAFAVSSNHKAHKRIFFPFNFAVSSTYGFLQLYGSDWLPISRGRRWWNLHKTTRSVQRPRLTHDSRVSPPPPCPAHATSPRDPSSTTSATSEAAFETNERERERAPKRTDNLFHVSLPHSPNLSSQNTPSIFLIYVLAAPLVSASTPKTTCSNGFTRTFSPPHLQRFQALLCLLLLLLLLLLILRFLQSKEEA